jgi:hypothetical protein
MIINKNFQIPAGGNKFPLRFVALWVTLALLVLFKCTPEIDCESDPTREISPIIDQFTSLSPTPPFSYNIEGFKPTGQSFVPSLNALDFVSLYIDDASCSQTGSESGDLYVRIRKTSITDEIVGASNVVHFNNCFVGVKQFQFSPYVKLSPRKQYFIEVVYESGSVASAYVSENPMAYSKGIFYLEGKEQPYADMVFQEGIFYSLPKSKCDCKELFKYVVNSSGLPFKNQGDCIKFINHQD